MFNDERLNAFSLWYDWENFKGSVLLMSIQQSTGNPSQYKEAKQTNEQRSILTGKEHTELFLFTGVT